MTFPLQLDWRRGPDMPFAMDDYIQSVEVEGTLYVGGGLADKTNNMYIVMAYDTQSCKWHTLPPYSAEKFAMTTIHNKLVLVGGRNNYYDVDQLGVWQTDSNQWTLPFPPMPTPHHSPSATSYKHWLVVAGGSILTSLLNVEVLNVDNNQWSTGPSIPTPWQSMKSTTIGDTWYLMGGYDDWVFVVIIFLWKLLLHTRQQTVPTYGENYPVPTIPVPVLSTLKDLYLHLVVGTERRCVVCPPSSAMCLRLIPG